MRVVKYKTKLIEDRKVVLEKEVSMNCPDLDKGLILYTKQAENI